MKSRLSRRYATLQKQLATIGPVSQGSVAFQAPGSWRWTFKINGKTACVALSEEQATQMTEAIDNHKRLEETVREMREIIPGDGKRAQWIDRGAPATESHPASAPRRFYRVERLEQ